MLTCHSMRCTRKHQVPIGMRWQVQWLSSAEHTHTLKTLKRSEIPFGSSPSSLGNQHTGLAANTCCTQQFLHLGFFHSP